jgi:hypothetical protein
MRSKMALGSKDGTTKNETTDDTRLANTQIASVDKHENAAEFPDGKNADDYNGSDLWSCHRWAWEFLRRNRDFQRQCDEIEAKPTPAAKQEIKERFGLVRYKYYGEEYGTTKKQRPKFTTGNVVCWPRVTEKIYRGIKPNLPKELKPGQVLFRFDLRKLAVTEKSSIRAMLADAEKDLKRAAELWLKELGEKPKSPPRNREEPLPFLRLLDLKHHWGRELSPEQMLVIAYENFAEDLNSEDSVDDPKRTYKRKMKSAIAYTDSRYLHLAASEGLPAPIKRKGLVAAKNP